MHCRCAMNGGEGPNSYAQNSSYQKGFVDAAKPIIEEEISRKLDIKHLSSTFRIADFGCSTGHNSLAAMQIITEAIRRRFETEGLMSQIPDFYVFFSDKVTNDFNTLFKSLPRERLYGAAGVPGSFHGRLLPKAMLDFAYSNCSLNWLSELPKAMLDNTSPAWNRGKIHYAEARKEVCEEYANQYAKDIESFLDSRAEELVPGGLMALLVPAIPASWDPNSAYATTTEIYLLGSCLMDMAKAVQSDTHYAKEKVLQPISQFHHITLVGRKSPKNKELLLLLQGRISEAKVDSFNIPVYFPIPQEFEAIIERNDKYTIERMEILDNQAGKHNLTGPKDRAAYCRAVSEGVLIDHFGGEIIEELFDRYTKKLAASPLFSDPDCDKSIIIFVLLRRKPESSCSGS
ncbi:UNVERIFIED_CONTAM: Loganic acid O-methyltransferase [Sesamum radiatum]|uniref:Loganic acid O-methyltransferase n=1 Tax=Sesamum radiatum TaxID=300843 RepID=A0AAW2TVD4_SESRA